MEDFFRIIPYTMGMGTLLFAGVLVSLPLLISHQRKGELRDTTYESGMPVIGRAWIQFPAQYYLYALVFMGFDVETAFIVPVVTILRKSSGWLPSLELIGFLVVLSLSLVYALKKKVLEWK